MTTPPDPPTDTGVTAASPPVTPAVQHPVTNADGDHGDGSGHFVPDGDSKGNLDGSIRYLRNVNLHLCHFELLVRFDFYPPLSSEITSMATGHQFLKGVVCTTPGSVATDCARR